MSKTLLELAPGEDTCVRAHGLFSLEQNKGSWPKHSPFKKKKNPSTYLISFYFLSTFDIFLVLLIPFSVYFQNVLL